MAKSTLVSFLLGFLGAIIFWLVFAVIGAFRVRGHGGSASGAAVVTACATTPLGITLLFPILDAFGVKIVFGIPFGWLITLVAFIWAVIAEVRALAAIP